MFHLEYGYIYIFYRRIKYPIFFILWISSILIFYMFMYRNSKIYNKNNQKLRKLRKLELWMRVFTFSDGFILFSYIK